MQVMLECWLVQPAQAKAQGIQSAHVARQARSEKRTSAFLMSRIRAHVQPCNWGTEEPEGAEPIAAVDFSDRCIAGDWR